MVHKQETSWSQPLKSQLRVHRQPQEISNHNCRSGDCEGHKDHEHFQVDNSEWKIAEGLHPTVQEQQHLVPI